MNPITRWCAICASAIALLILMALMGGPSEIEAAQDAADESAALQHAADKAACRKLYGRDAQMYLLEGQHLVCRERVRVAGGAK